MTIPKIIITGIVAALVSVTWISTRHLDLEQAGWLGFVVAVDLYFVVFADHFVWGKR